MSMLALGSENPGGYRAPLHIHFHFRAGDYREVRGSLYVHFNSLAVDYRGVRGRLQVDFNFARRTTGDYGFLPEGTNWSLTC